ncbi:MAG: hypothetical protein NZ528_03550, partial [Caldilineales bacterium]|nr:hypothetical protein [Caldilineales bacterium]
MDDARNPQSFFEPADPYADDPEATIAADEPLTRADLGLSAAPGTPLPSAGRDTVRLATQQVGETHAAEGDDTSAEVEAAAAVEAAFGGAFEEAVAGAEEAPAVASDAPSAAASVEAVMEEAYDRPAPAV